MDRLKKFQSWVSAYEKANGVFPEPSAIKFKIKELLREANLDKATKKVEQIYFRDSIYSDYGTLREYLAKDSKFVKEYQGVDLKAYIESALSWSEAGNKRTDLGWMFTLKVWMRRAKSEGKLIMLQKQVHFKRKEY